METVTAIHDSSELSIMRKINLIFRFSYTIPFFLASLCGIVYAIPFGVPAHIAALIPIAVLIMAVLVNFSNDYYDHKSGIDAMVNEERYRVAKEQILSSEKMKKLYWEGNQFDTGLVSEKQGIAIMAGLVTLLLLVSVPVIIHGGWITIAFGVLGLIFTFFYTAPPVNFGARGLGEVVVGISFFMMTFCSFYIATGTFDVQIILFSVMVGLVVGLMRLGDSLSAHDAHVQYGERCISVRIGLDGTIPLIKCIIVLAHAISIVMMYYNLAYGLLLITILMTSKIWKAMNAKKEHWELKVIPYFFGFSMLTEIMFIIAAIITMSAGPIVFW